MTGLVATSQIDIDAPPDRVWTALTEPDTIREYMFGTQISTDWQPGSPITWTGEWEGKPYEDHGEILEVEPGRHLSVTHFSPLTSQPDRPENYHRLDYDLQPHGTGTLLTLRQDNNASPEEVEHSRSNWETMLRGIKRIIETG